jgi:replicative DNA helicase
MKTQLAGVRAETTGLETGFTDLDEILLNLQPGCLYLIAGATGMGKSSFCLDVAYHVGTKAQLPVAIFSPETSETAVVEWITCSQSSINHRDLRRGLLQDSEWHRYTNTIAKLMSARIFISPAQTIFVSEIRDECLKLQDEHNPIGLIVVDSLQLLKDVTECRAQEMLSAVCALKHLARELNTVVLLTSQISPWHLKRDDKTPQLIDLLQWGGIEAVADAVLFIYRPELYASRLYPSERACRSSFRSVRKHFRGKES